MDKLDNLLKEIASYKVCSYRDIEDTIGLALIAAIVKELIRLGYDEYESVDFEPSKAKRRYMQDTIGVCYYSTNGPLDHYSFCTVDGQKYALMQDYRTQEGLCNREELQVCHLPVLERIYDYLRLERKSNSLKKK